MQSQRVIPPRQYAAEGLRPQTLLFTFLGHHILDNHPDGALATSTIIEVLDRLEVSAQAARSTLTRMVTRGYLHRHRSGRRAYFSLSPSLKKLLHDGESRLFSTPVRELPDGGWTLLSFSIPEGQRGDRHTLRTTMGWHGFGLLRNGLWIAPGVVDMAEDLNRLGLQDRTEVFAAHPMAPTDIRRIVAEAWDLDAIQAEYREFIDRWSDTMPPEVSGALAGQVRLLTEWRQMLVDDPQLPVAHLPDGWPAQRAYELFRSRLDDLQADAARELTDILDLLDPAAG